LVAATKKIFFVPNFVAVTKPFFPCVFVRESYEVQQPVLSVQKVFSGSARSGRLRLMGKYISHRLVARPEPDLLD